jgi:hypothetical protein
LVGVSSTLGVNVAVAFAVGGGGSSGAAAAVVVVVVVAAIEVFPFSLAAVSTLVVFVSVLETGTCKLAGAKEELLLIDDAAFIPKVAVVEPRMFDFESSCWGVLVFGATNDDVVVAETAAAGVTGAVFNSGLTESIWVVALVEDAVDVDEAAGLVTGNFKLNSEEEAPMFKLLLAPKRLELMGLACWSIVDDDDVDDAPIDADVGICVVLAVAKLKPPAKLMLPPKLGATLSEGALALSGCVMLDDEGWDDDEIGRPKLSAAGLLVACWALGKFSNWVRPVVAGMPPPPPPPVVEKVDVFSADDIGARVALVVDGVIEALTGLDWPNRFCDDAEELNEKVGATVLALFGCKGVCRFINDLLEASAEPNRLVDDVDDTDGATVAVVAPAAPKLNELLKPRPVLPGVPPWPSGAAAVPNEKGDPVTVPLVSAGDEFNENEKGLLLLFDVDIFFFICLKTKTIESNATLA